jgi:hypothetical protein
VIFRERPTLPYHTTTLKQGLGRYAKIITVGPTQASGPVLILP